MAPYCGDPILWPNTCIGNGHVMASEQQAHRASNPAAMYANAGQDNPHSRVMHPKMTNYNGDAAKGSGAPERHKGLQSAPAQCPPQAIAACRPGGSSSCH
eukprot:364557-Chlamydomonas_euryale.AAC.14